MSQPQGGSPPMPIQQPMGGGAGLGPTATLSPTGKFGAATQQVAGMPVGKHRNPWMVLLLSIITLGIYGIFWWYASFQEVKDYRRGAGPGGVLAIVFLLIGLLSIFLPFMLASNIGAAQRQYGRPTSVSGLTGLWVFLPIVGGIVYLVRVQNAMNRLWNPMLI